MLKRLLGVTALALSAAACEAPWTLVESGTASDTLNAVGRASDTPVYLGGTGVYRLETVASTPEKLTLVGANDQELPAGTRVLGVLVLGKTDVYAWTSDAVLHLVGNSLKAIAVPAVLGGGATWEPVAMAKLDGSHVVLAAKSNGHVHVFEGDAAMLTAVDRNTLENADLTALTRTSWGTVLAVGEDGHGNGVAFERLGDGWHARTGDIPSGARRVASSTDQVIILTSKGVVGLDYRDLKEDAALRLDGTFEDVCAFRDSRFALVGPAQWALFPMWSLEGKQWANLNTGTRETLHAVDCGADGKVLAAGNNGMAILQP